MHLCMLAVLAVSQKASAATDGRPGRRIQHLTQALTSPSRRPSSFMSAASLLCSCSHSSHRMDCSWPSATMFLQTPRQASGLVASSSPCQQADRYRLSPQIALHDTVRSMQHGVHISCSCQPEVVHAAHGWPDPHGSRLLDQGPHCACSITLCHARAQACPQLHFSVPCSHWHQSACL